MRIGLFGRQRSTWSEIKWSKASPLYNLFRIGEYLFGRKNTIRAEARTIVIRDEDGYLHIRREFYTWEAFFVFIEQIALDFLLVPFGLRVPDWQKVMMLAHPRFLEFGAIAFDLATSNTGSGASVSFTHTITGSNPFLAGYGGRATVNARVTVMTWNTNETMLVGVESTGASAYTVFYQLAAPTTGAKTIAYTWNPVPGASRQLQIAMSYSGVAQSSPIGVTGVLNSATATSAITVTSTVANSWLVSGVTWGTSSGAITVNSPNVSRFNGVDSQAFPHATADQPTTSVGSYTSSYSHASESQSHSVMEVLPVSVTMTASVSDSISITENVTQVQVFNASVSDSISLTESVTLVQVFVISTSDGISLSESVSQQLILLQSVNDTISISELVTTNVQAFQSVSDAIAITESVSVAHAFNASVSDAISITESVTVTLVSTQSVSDAVSITESQTLSLTMLPATVFDAISITESQTLSLTTFQSVADTISITENLTELDIEMGTVNDAVSIAESVTVLLIRFLPSISDALSISESVSSNFIRFVPEPLQYRPRGYAERGAGLSVGGSI